VEINRAFGGLGGKIGGNVVYAQAHMNGEKLGGS
jgi:hypothetical protein